MKEKIEKQAIDFQPDAIAIKRETLPWWGRHSVLLVFIIVAILIAWACIGQVDVVVTAPGKVVSARQNIVMKPLERTVIKEINVEVGQRVKEGDILFTFDPSLNESNLIRVEGDMETLEAKYNRLQAEFNDKEYVVSDDANKSELVQEEIFKQRKRYYNERMKYFEQGIERYQAQIVSTEANCAAYEEMLAQVSKIEEMFNALSKSKAATKKELLEITISRLQYEAQLINYKNSLPMIIHEMNSTVASRDSFKEEWRNSISEEMVSVNRELRSIKKDYEQIVTLLKYVYLEAPCDAIVHEIASFPPGSAVREAEALITLVPLNNEIEVEVEIPPRDIGKVSAGSPARVKLTPFPFQKHGTLDGVVRTISEDTFQKQSGEQITDERSYYRSRVTIDGELKHVKEDFRLIPGMEVIAEIKTGRRRIITYVIYPLIKSLDETMREP